MIRKCICAVGLTAVGLASPTHAGVTQIGDLRLPDTAYPATTSFDPGFPAGITRSVAGAPVEINSTFIGGSQQANGVINDEDIALRTTATQKMRVRNLSRFAPSIDGGATGPSRVGMVQWSFDLSPLDTYLTDNGLTMTALDLDFVLDPTDDTKKYDIYLSYDNIAEAIALTSIDSTTVGAADSSGGAGALNWANFFDPARGSSVGDVINGTHRVLQIDNIGDLTTSESLLALYNLGVRNFNLQVAGGDFWSSRNIDVNEGAGLSITTVPEPASLALVGVGLVMIAGRRKK